MDIGTLDIDRVQQVLLKEGLSWEALDCFRGNIYLNCNIDSIASLYEE